MRLNKYLAKSGVASRRESDRMIQEGAVTVNNHIVMDPAYQVQDNDKIVFDGRILKLVDEVVVYMLNKPKNVITTAKDTHGRRTVIEFIPSKTRLFPIGRLDKDTTGLILLTNDGELANYLMHPRNRIPRFYEVEIDGRLSPKEIAKIKKGVFIGEGEFGRGVVEKQSTRKTRSIVRIRLLQGKKREVRRIFEFLGKKVYSLQRHQYGSLLLGNLEVGQWRKLSDPEIKKLKNKS